jgi:hypothetical protein
MINLLAFDKQFKSAQLDNWSFARSSNFTQDSTHNSTKRAYNVHAITKGTSVRNNNEVIGSEVGAIIMTLL